MTARFKNAFLALAMAVAFGVAPRTCSCQAQPPASPGGWYWMGADCRQCQKLRLELFLDGKLVYRCSIRVRRLIREDVSSNHVAQALVFSIRGGHRFQDEYATTPEQAIAANVWQAGVEPDLLVLGLSFATKGQILLNTLHFAAPDRASETLLDRGLLIRTHPEPRSRP